VAPCCSQRAAQGREQTRPFPGVHGGRVGGGAHIALGGQHGIAGLAPPGPAQHVPQHVPLQGGGGGGGQTAPVGQQLIGSAPADALPLPAAGATQQAVGVPRQHVEVQQRAMGVVPVPAPQHRAVGAADVVPPQHGAAPVVVQQPIGAVAPQQPVDAPAQHTAGDAATGGGGEQHLPLADVPVPAQHTVVVPAQHTAGDAPVDDAPVDDAPVGAVAQQPPEGVPELLQHTTAVAPVGVAPAQHGSTGLAVAAPDWTGTQGGQMVLVAAGRQGGGQPAAGHGEHGPVAGQSAGAAAGALWPPAAGAGPDGD
jgi:hypothetical protein